MGGSSIEKRITKRSPPPITLSLPFAYRVHSSRDLGTRLCTRVCPRSITHLQLLLSVWSCFCRCSTDSHNIRRMVVCREPGPGCFLDRPDVRGGRSAHGYQRLPPPGPTGGVSQIGSSVVLGADVRLTWTVIRFTGEMPKENKRKSGHCAAQCRPNCGPFISSMDVGLLHIEVG